MGSIMTKLNFRLIFILIFFLTASSAFGAQLRWSAVENTDTCIIGGYKVHYGTDPEQLDQIIDVYNITSYELDNLTFLPATTYYFAVSAYSTSHLDGPSSNPIPYMDSPSIVGYPAIDRAAGTIEITFNESVILGADTKANYNFSPTILFDPAYQILRIDKTYRLHMTYIPQHTIFTLTLNNITDNKGLALLSNIIVMNDDDNDKMADDWESDYGISFPFLDADNDGLQNIEEYTAGTNPVNSDTDNDSMDDNWEIQNNLDPLTDDSLGDIDNDGISNIDEYNGITIPPVNGPDKPILSFPANTAKNVQLAPQLITYAYTDKDNNVHAKTQWQISTDSSFNSAATFVFEIETYNHLTSLTMPDFILNPDRTYYWRVRFFDVLENTSVWSDASSFATVAVNAEDLDADGVHDIQKTPDGLIDLNGDGSLDISSDSYKMISYESQALSLQASVNITAIDNLKAISPDEITDTVGKPADLPFGLIQFKLRVRTLGDTAELKIYFSEPVGKQWYKYDLANGWTEYSNDYPENVQFSADGKSIILTLVDGGAGDSDGVANGFIVDPSGPGLSINERKIPSDKKVPPGQAKK